MVEFFWELSYTILGNFIHAFSPTVFYFWLCNWYLELLPNKFQIVYMLIIFEWDGANGPKWALSNLFPDKDVSWVPFLIGSEVVSGLKS
jgi:hypothetical protein